MKLNTDPKHRTEGEEGMNKATVKGKLRQKDCRGSYTKLAVRGPYLQLPCVFLGPLPGIKQEQLLVVFVL